MFLHLSAAASYNYNRTLADDISISGKRANLMLVGVTLKCDWLYSVFQTFKHFHSTANYTGSLLFPLPLAAIFPLVKLACWQELSFATRNKTPVLTSYL